MKPAAVLGSAARLRKLRAMSTREVLGRLQYRCLTALEHQSYRRGRLAPPNRLEKALVRDLRRPDWRSALLHSRRASTSRFFPSATERLQLRELFASRFEAERTETCLHAAHARAQRFEFFGQEFHYPGEIDWQADPVTGRRWPRTYHAAVPIHSGDVGYGDVKHVWELSRQQYVIDLGKAVFLTDNGEDLTALRRLVSSWIEGNPYATGVNWSCALEPAFRAWSWLWAYYLAIENLDHDFHLAWLQSFYDHGRFLNRHLEYFASPYNHLIGEASALFALGHCFPEFREAAEWRRRGRGVLENRLNDQFYQDGGSVEQSTFYHHATVGFYVLAALLGRRNGDELSPAVWRALERGLDFSMHLAQPDGRTPEIGGADDGKPIRMQHLPFWDFRAYQAIGAVLFNRRDYKAFAGRFYEDALWLLGISGLHAFDALEQRLPEQTTVVLNGSGYAVSRSDWSAQADYVCFDAGEQAAGMRTDDVPNSMHGHADCLSILVSLGGRRVLVDSGLFAYNCGGEWEAHFRETAAHNTARIDGRDQALHIRKMAWSNSYRAAIESWIADERQAWIVGSHDGYARGPQGVTHRRTVWRRPGGYILVHDEFVGTGTHDLEINFQFAPGELRTAGDARAVYEDFVDLCWLGEGQWSAETRCGGPRPADGWICTSLGVRQAAPRLTLTGSFAGGRATVLAILTNGTGRTIVDRTTSGTTAVGIRGDGYVDWVVSAGLSVPAGVSTDASVAVYRMRDEDVVERTMVGGTFFKIIGRSLDDIAKPEPAHRA